LCHGDGVLHEPFLPSGGNGSLAGWRPKDGDQLGPERGREVFHSGTMLAHDQLQLRHACAGVQQPGRISDTARRQDGRGKQFQQGQRGAWLDGSCEPSKRHCDGLSRRFRSVLESWRSSACRGHLQRRPCCRRRWLALHVLRCASCRSGAGSLTLARSRHPHACAQLGSKKRGMRIRMRAVVRQWTTPYFSSF
jgi:hypothetical protein